MRIEFFNDALEKHCQFGRKGTEIGQSKERCRISTFYQQKTGLKELLSCKYVLQICETETDRAEIGIKGRTTGAKDRAKSFKRLA